MNHGQAHSSADGRVCAFDGPAALRVTLVVTLIAALLTAGWASSADAANGILSDERVTMPRNYIAADVGTWDTTANTIFSETLIENPVGSGLMGQYYEDCAGLKLWHAQHIVRLRNRHGNAYFVTANSNAADRPTRSGGYISVIRVDEAFVDDATDRIASSISSFLGEYIWEDRYDQTNPRGNWNHPGKMVVIGDLLVVSMEQFSPSFLCGGSGVGTSPDSIAFYDVKDPERPKFIALLENNWTVNSIGMYATRNTNPQSWLITTENTPSSVIQDEYRYCASSILPTFFDFNIPPENFWTPVPSTWGTCPINPNGDGLSRQYGSEFSSYQLISDPIADSVPNVATICSAAGSLHEQTCRERMMNFVPLLESNYAFQVVDGVQYPIPATIIIPGSSKFRFSEIDPLTYTIPDSFRSEHPLGFYGSPRNWEDMSVYTTEKGMLIAYAMNNSQFTYPGGSNSNAVIVQVVNLGNFLLETPHPSRRVTSLADRGPGTLRNALSYGTAPGKKIDFDPALNGGTITLTGGPLVAYLYDVTIDASDLPDGITISGNNASRVFEVAEGIDVTIRNVTLRNGLAEQGAGLLNNGGNVTLENCVVKNNHAVPSLVIPPTGAPSPHTGTGGGLQNGLLAFDDGRIERNEYWGRVLPLQTYPVENGRMKLVKTTVEGNSASRSGGGVANIGGTLLVDRSSITNNSAGIDGGGVYNSSGLRRELAGSRTGAVTIENSTIAENTASTLASGAGIGGAIVNDVNPDPCLTLLGGLPVFCAATGKIMINQSTIANNENFSTLPPENCAGACNEPGGALVFENSILAFNTNGLGNLRDIGGAYDTQDFDNGFTYNVFTSTAGGTLGTGFPPFGGDPKLAPLANYGGPTRSLLTPHLPLVIPMAQNSRALIVPGPVLLVDQREVPRSDPPKQIGATEHITLAEALDSSGVLTNVASVPTLGDSPWFGQSTVQCDTPSFGTCDAFTDFDAAQSGFMANAENGSSAMSAQITGPTRLVFYARVQNQPSELFPLVISLDGVVAQIRYSPNWSKIGIEIPPGSHTVQWRFDVARGPGTNSTGSAAFVDNVSLEPTAVAWNVPDGQPGSLRSVVANAPVGSTVRVDSSVSLVELTLGEIAIEAGRNLTIDASAFPARPRVIVDGKGLGRTFSIAPDTTVTLRGLEMRGGVSNTGGALANFGTLNVVDCTFSGNRAANPAGFGGALFNATGSSLSIAGSTFTQNTADGNGGALYNDGQLTITDSTLDGNHAQAGGGIFNSLGTIQSITRSTLSNNDATYRGGALSNDPGRNVFIINSTLAGNTANQNGGAAFNRGFLLFLYSTVSSNAAIESPPLIPSSSTGGGIDNDGGTLQLVNSIVAANQGPVAGNGREILNHNGGQIAPPIGANLIGNNDTVEFAFDGANPLVGTSAAPLDPRLLALGQYGGPTKTMHPLLDSPAIDAGPSTIYNQSDDQRGSPRPVVAGNDLGAIEVPEPGFAAGLGCGLLFIAGLRSRRVRSIEVGVGITGGNFFNHR